MWGRIIGTLLGLAVARLPGAVLGFALGYWFDRSYAQQIRQGGFTSLFKDSDLKHSQASFFFAMFATLGHLAKSKGRVTESDIAQAQTLMESLELPARTMQEAQQAFREGKDPAFPLEATLKRFRQDSRGRYDLLQLFMEQLISAALNDAKLERNEYDVLLRASRALGFNKFQLDRWLLMAGAQARFGQRQSQRQSGGGPRTKSSQSQQRSQQHHSQSQNQYRAQQQRSELQDAYQSLGLDEQVSDDDLKKAYRKLMREHHPDKLSAQGLPAEMLKTATKRSQDIQAAYDKIKRARGLR